MCVSFFQTLLIASREMANNCSLNHFTGISIITLSTDTSMILTQTGDEAEGGRCADKKGTGNFQQVLVSLPVCLPFTDAWIRTSLQSGEWGTEGLHILNNQLSKVNNKSQY